MELVAKESQTGIFDNPTQIAIVDESNTKKMEQK
jgi:hypothetical protein